MDCRSAIFATTVLLAAGVAQARQPKEPPADQAQPLQEVPLDQAAPLDHGPPIDHAPPVDHGHPGYPYDPYVAEPRGAPPSFDRMCGSDGGGCEDCGDWCSFGCGCPPHGLWVRGEFIEWWMRGASLPPLVTSSPTGTAQAAAGILPAAQVLFGNERVDTHGRSGSRVTLGYWLDDCEAEGVEGNFFILGSTGTSFLESSNGAAGSLILARPFIDISNPATPTENARLVAFPAVSSGSIVASTSSKVLGAELNYRRALADGGCGGRVDLLGGYRFFHLREELDITNTSTSLAANGQVPAGTILTESDFFSTWNDFNGAQLGLMFQRKRGRLSANLTTKLALGVMSQRVTLNGNNSVFDPTTGVTTTSAQGLLVQSNAGTFRRTRFSALPELALNLNYQLNEVWGANFGYALLYVQNVARPGDQVDRRINLVNHTQPPFAFNDTNIWLQGLQVGLEAKF